MMALHKQKTRLIAIHAPLGRNIRCALKCHRYSVMVFYLSESILYSYEAVKNLLFNQVCWMRVANVRLLSAKNLFI